MTISRRMALEFASGLAVLGGSPGVALASGNTAFGAASWSGQRTAQRFRPLVVHRDETGGFPHHATLWIEAADSPWMVIEDLDARGYRQASAKYESRGYRLRRINGFETPKGSRYAAIWQHATGPQYQAQRDLTLAEFERESAQLAQQGHRLTYIDARGTQSGAAYCAIWEKDGGPQQDVSAMLTAGEYERKFANLTAQGFRPVGISSYALHGEPRFAAIFEKSSGRAWDARHQMTEAAFKTKNSAMLARGYWLTDVSGYAAGKQPVFSGIWEKA